FIVTMALTLILRDYQPMFGVKPFLFDASRLAPFISAVICILIFKNKRAQLSGLKFTISLTVINRLLLALILPLVIFIIGMVIFNTMADSFILLQASNLSVTVLAVLIGHLMMAFFAEFGFRSYLQTVVESKVNTFIASIIVGLMYAIWTINTTYNL
ncbi:CPBP family glutamic-type intramembrane protease, partial [Staphylococcus epidermidis]